MTDKEAHEYLTKHRPVIIHRIRTTRERYGSIDQRNIAKLVINYDDHPDLKDMIRKAVKYMYDNSTAI